MREYDKPQTFTKGPQLFGTTIMVQYRDAGNGRRRLLEKLQSLAGKARPRGARNACDVSTWAGETRDEAIFDRVTATCHDNRNCGCSVFYGADCRGSDRYDDINGKLDQFLRQSRKPAHIRIGKTGFNDIVFPINVTKPLQSFVKDFEVPGRIFSGWGSRGVEPADVPHSALSHCIWNTRQKSGADNNNRGEDGFVQHMNQPFGDAGAQNGPLSAVLRHTHAVIVCSLCVDFQSCWYGRCSQRIDRDCARSVPLHSRNLWNTE